MSVKRFVASNAREAMAQVRRALGEDAVILSNRRVATGIELCAVAAARMNDLIEPAPLLHAPAPAKRRVVAREALGHEVEAPEPVAETPAAEPAIRGFREFLDSRQNSTQAASADIPSTAGFVRERSEKSRSVVQPAATQSARAAPPLAARASARPSTKTPAAPVHGVVDESLMAEIQSMKGLLHDQLSAFAWFEAARKHPLHAKLIGTLLGAGFSPALSRHVVERLPADYGDAQANTWLATALARNLPCQAEEDNLLDRGGVFALVGPTGVGKTTTTAKLAARYALRYGAQCVGLVTTDSYRIGAHDQLRIYGKILGIPVHLAQGASLRGLVDSLREKRVIIIDTVGVGQRDGRVPEQMQQLDEAGVAKVLLLSAAAQGETLDEVIRVYQRFGLAGAIVTKIDEAAKLGQALDCVIRHQLRLPFVTNGQRVPEDLHPAHAAFLVHRAIKSASQPAFSLNDEDHGILFARARLPHDVNGPRHEGQKHAGRAAR